MNESMTPLILWADSRWVSPWVLSVWVALHEKGVPFQVQELDLASGQHRRGDYPRKTVSGKVPAITHGDVWIAESLAIVEYLDEVFPDPPLFGEDPAARALDRHAMSYLRSDFNELRRCMPFEGIFLDVKTPKITPDARDQCRRLLSLVDWRLASRSRSPLTIADYELAIMLRRLIHYKGPLTPQARTYSNAIWKRPPIQAWLKQDRSRFLAAEPASRPRKKRKAAHRATKSRTRRTGRR